MKTHSCAKLTLILSLFAISTQLIALESKTLELPPSTQLPTASMSSSIWQMALGLLFVLGIIFLLTWLMRRVTGFQGTKQHIKVLSAINVGTRERAVLVEVAGEQLLLGVAAGQVNLLHKIAEPIVETNGRANAKQSSVDFATSLQQAVTKLGIKSAPSDSEK